MSINFVNVVLAAALVVLGISQLKTLALVSRLNKRVEILDTEIYNLMHSLDMISPSPSAAPHEEHERS